MARNLNAICNFDLVTGYDLYFQSLELQLSTGCSNIHMLCIAQANILLLALHLRSLLPTARRSLLYCLISVESKNGFEITHCMT